jgi:chromosome segregation ATPase
MSDSDDLRHDSLGPTGWYLLGQQDQQQRDRFRRVVRRFAGTGPEARLNALAAENERLVTYANDLVQEVDALQRENATLRNQNSVLSEDYRKLKEWATTADATLRRNAYLSQDLADQSDDIARLNEIIDQLQDELESLREPPIRTD